MGHVFESLKEYLKAASEEELQEDWSALDHLNEVGTDALVYANQIELTLGLDLSGPDHHEEEGHSFSSNAMNYLAA